jgi:hypothetical protein
MISSVNPSLKYSFSGFGLKFKKGKTAIDLAPAGAAFTDIGDSSIGVMTEDA